MGWFNGSPAPMGRPADTAMVAGCMVAGSTVLAYFTTAEGCSSLPSA